MIIILRKNRTSDFHTYIFHELDLQIVPGNKEIIRTERFSGVLFSRCLDNRSRDPEIGVRGNQKQLSVSDHFHSREKDDSSLSNSLTVPGFKGVTSFPRN